MGVDRHISAVRNKLALGKFLLALAWATLILGVAVWMAVIAQKVFDRTLPYQGMWLWMGLAIAAGIAVVWSVLNRPSAPAVAIAIDEALGLKEKFSTALYVRPSDDPFARAVVVDAEAAAANVSLYGRFPLQFPRSGAVAVVVFILALLTAELMPDLHLFGNTVSNKPAVALVTDQPPQEKLLKDQMPRIEAGAKLLSDDDAIRRASAELEKAAQTTEGDKLTTQRSALSALQDYQKAMKEQLEKNQDFQNAQSAKQQLADMDSAKDDSTPMGKAHNELKAGDLDAAMNDMAKAVDDFNKAKPEDQQKMIQQAQQLAQQLAHAANDPRAGQKMIQQLMQAGATQSQAQQMAAAMQQAAAGNQQAQQQMQQMAQQMAKQMNNGQGPTPQQQQRIQSMMAKAQALANSQSQAGALSNSVQQLASAMAQAKGQTQNQPGQQPKPGQGQQMSQAAQGVQQQLQQMQATAKDAQAMQASADAAAQAAADAAAGLNSNSNGSGSGDSQNNGKDNQGQADAGQNPGPNGGNNGQGGGAGGKGLGGVKNPDMVEAPFHMKQVVDPSKDIEGGKILASRYVKAGIDSGQSTAGLREIAASAEKDAPDEIEQDHISREAQQSVKDYFSAMQDSDQP